MSPFVGVSRCTGKAISVIGGQSSAALTFESMAAMIIDKMERILIFLLLHEKKLRNHDLFFAATCPSPQQYKEKNEENTAGLVEGTTGA